LLSGLTRLPIDFNQGQAEVFIFGSLPLWKESTFLSPGEGYAVPVWLASKTNFIFIPRHQVRVFHYDSTFLSG
jgi:hypothetical protein